MLKKFTYVTVKCSKNQLNYICVIHRKIVNIASTLTALTALTLYALCNLTLNNLITNYQVHLNIILHFRSPGVSLSRQQEKTSTIGCVCKNLQRKETKTQVNLQDLRINRGCIIYRYFRSYIKFHKVDLLLNSFQLLMI